MTRTALVLAVTLALALPASGGAQATATKGLWTSAAELASRPLSGAAWQAVKSAADADWGSAEISRQDSDHDTSALAGAIVYARTGDGSYRAKVAAAVLSAIGTERGGEPLALGRNLVSYVIAADLIDLASYDPAGDERFRSWLSAVRTESLGGDTLISTHEERANNWGTMAGASREAADAYLGDTADLARAAQVFRGWLGDRSAYAGFDYGDTSWQADPGAPVGINPPGAVKEGHPIDGALPEEMRRGCSFRWPPCQTDYPWGGLSAAVVQAEILHRAGYDSYNWSSQAIKRAVAYLDYLGSLDPFWLEGATKRGTGWVTWIVNHAYGTSFAARSATRPGQEMGWADYVFGSGGGAGLPGGGGGRPGGGGGHSGGGSGGPAGGGSGAGLGGAPAGGAGGSGAGPGGAQAGGAGGSGESTGGAGGGGGASPDLAVAVSASASSVQVGDAFAYRVDVTTKSAASATGLKLTVALPSQVALVSSYATRGSGCTGTQTLSCDLDFISPGLVGEVQIIVRVTSPGDLVASASVIADAHDLDPTDNQASLNLPRVLAARSVGQRGAPRLARTGGAFAPPLRARAQGPVAIVSTRFSVDGPATLRVSALAPRSRPLALLKGSRVGSTVSGRQRRAIFHRLGAAGAPRLTLQLEIPLAFLRTDAIYEIRILATGPQGQSSTLTIPFRRPADVSTPIDGAAQPGPDAVRPDPAGLLP